MLEKSMSIVDVDVPALLEDSTGPFYFNILKLSTFLPNVSQQPTNEGKALAKGKCNFNSVF
jgi:hypothetical protein